MVRLELPISLFVIIIVSLSFILITGGVVTSLITFSLYILGISFFLVGKFKQSFFDYTISYSVVLFFFLIVQLYTVVNFDVLQTTKDSAKFLHLLSPNYHDYSLDDLKYYVDSTLAVKIWQYSYIYEIEPLKPNNAILINVFVIACSVALLLKAVRLFYPDIDAVKGICIILISGLPLQFGTLLLRDSFLFLMVSFLCILYALWIKKQIGVWCYLLFVLILSFLSLYFRDALAIVFVIFFLMSVFFKYIFKLSTWKLVILLALCSIFIVIAFQAVSDIGLMIDYMSERADTYQNLALSSSEQGSLGVSIIYQQPFIIRVFSGSALLVLGSIPFWKGFVLGSAEYIFFISLYSFFMIITFPRFLKCSYLLFTERSPVFLFSLWYVIGVLLVASTSIELRHLGQFLPFYLIVILFSLNKPTYRLLGNTIDHVFYSFVFLIHIAWFALKFL